MDEVIFLEVLEDEEGVAARHRLERFPVTVGRGYTNDVILDDPKVSAAHLRIERTEQGALVLRDVLNEFVSSDIRCCSISIIVVIVFTNG